MWNYDNLSLALGVEIALSFSATGVSIDTRTLKSGEIYVAIKGENFDGNDYAAQALEKGAACAVVSRDIGSAKAIQVTDTLKALEKMAAYKRSVINPKVIGITGSVGKTSTKELIALALKAYATPGNFNNHIGVPLTLANMPDDTLYAVIEMGMNHAGEVKALCDIVKPDIAIVTGAAAAHLEFFASVEAIADAESEILACLPPHGIAVLNADNQYYEYILNIARSVKRKQILSYGKSGNIYAKMTDFKVTDSGSEITALLDFKEIKYRLSSFAPHQAVNSLAALAVVKFLELDVSQALKRLAAFQEPEGRGRVTKVTVMGKQITLIDDSYNASPDSIIAAMASLANFKRNKPSARTVMVLGDMLELGDGSAELHANLANSAQEYGIDAIITCGSLMKHLYEALPTDKKLAHYENSGKVGNEFIDILNDGDIVLIKGSHGSRMEHIFISIKNRTF